MSAFIEESLKNLWVILGLAALSLVLGWMLGRLLSRLLLQLLRRTRVTEIVSRWLKQPDASRVELWVRRILSWAIFLLAVWGAVSILNSHPDIRGFLEEAWKVTLSTAQQPAVILIFDLLLIGLATFLLFKCFGWLKTGYAKLALRIEVESSKRLRGLKIQKVQLLSKKQLTTFILTITKYSRYAVNLILFLIYLTGIFSLFPQTRKFVNGLLESIFQAISEGWSSFMEYLPSLLNLAIIIVVTHYTIKFIHFLFNEVEKKNITISGFYPEWARPTYQLVRVAVIILALVIAFPYLPGSSSPAFQGISIFIGALFSLGSTSVVGNIVAGIVLTYTRAFRMGDRVQIANSIGDVIDKGLLVTRIRTIKNVEVAIPNSMVLGSHIINYSMQAEERGLILNTKVTIGYGVPWRRMHETLIEAALATAYILPEPRPFVFQTSLDDFYVSYELNAYTREAEKMAGIYSELHQNIQDKCREAGIEIMSPHYGALRDGSGSTIPAVVSEAKEGKKR